MESNLRESRLQLRPSFTVLMAVYKSEKASFLDQALQSINSQTVKPDQIVIVKDGPLTPELNYVLNRWQTIFGSNYCQLITLSNNRGLGSALHEGTKFVRTEWIARMDSDDIAVKDRFAVQLETIQAHPELAILGGQIDEFDKQVNQPIGQRKVPLTNGEIYQFIKFRSPFNHPTVMIKKEILDQVGGYQPDGKIEDYFLWAKIIAQGEQVMNVSRVLVHMRVGAGMYERRGDWKNLKHIFRLRYFMRRKKIIHLHEEIIGDMLQVVNLLVPGRLRKLIYQKFIHK